MRTETKDGKGLPYGKDPADHPSVRPRVERLRDLLGKNPAEPIRVIEDFNWQVHHIAVAPNELMVVIDGLGGSEGKISHVNAYDPTGAILWSLPSRMELDRGTLLQFDPTGKDLLVCRDDSGTAN